LSKLLRKLEKKIWMDPQIAINLGGLQADALKNFSTTSNALSVYYAGNDTIPTERILAAIAGGRENIQEVDYAVFDSKLLEKHEIKTNQINGKTADDKVNELHLDLVELTANQIYLLASSIQISGELKRISKINIGRKISIGLKEGCLDQKKVNQSLIPKLNKYSHSCS